MPTVLKCLYCPRVFYGTYRLIDHFNKCHYKYTPGDSLNDTQEIRR